MVSGRKFARVGTRTAGLQGYYSICQLGDLNRKLQALQILNPTSRLKGHNATPYADSPDIKPKNLKLCAARPQIPLAKAPNPSAMHPERYTLLAACTRPHLYRPARNLVAEKPRPWPGEDRKRISYAPCTIRLPYGLGTRRGNPQHNTRH